MYEIHRGDSNLAMISDKDEQANHDTRYDEMKPMSGEEEVELDEDVHDEVQQWALGVGNEAGMKMVEKVGEKRKRPVSNAVI